jgi:hypothetical protein
MVTVHIRLSKNWESNPVINLAKALNVIIGSWLLATELVTGKTEDNEVIAMFLLDALVKLLEAFVLGREATFGGCVDNEDDFAFVFGERNRLAFLCKLG